VKGYRRTLTRLEFNTGMTAHEAEYDTLIMALKTLLRQEKARDVLLDVQMPSQLVVNQIKGDWEARDPRMQARRDQAREMLGQFASTTLTRIPREQANRLLAE
jgi:ribonuclease HI